MNRRDVLRVGAVAGATLAGCSTREEPPPPTPTRVPPTVGPPDTEARMEQYTAQFGTVVNAASAGAGPGSGRSLDAFLDEVAGDDTLVYLPNGRYPMDDYWNYPTFDNFGLVGDDATIVPPDGYDHAFFGFGQPEAARRLLIDGITFDFRATRTGGRPLIVKVSDALVVRDVTVVGQLDVEAPMMRFDVTADDGQGLVERLRLPDGATVQAWAYGCLVGETNRGDITFRDCHIAGFPNNGLYAEPPSGRIRVVGGRYENNNVSNVRVAGGALVKGVHVRCDRQREGFNNMRGIRLRTGTDAVVEDCFVEFENVSASDGGIVLPGTMDAATIRNTRVRMSADNVAAVLCKPPERNDGRQALRCESVCIDGSAANTAAILVENRDGCVFDDVSIRQTGRNRDGIEVIGSDDGVVRNSKISVTGEPLVVVNSTISTENVWTNNDPARSIVDCSANGRPDG